MLKWRLYYDRDYNITSIGFTDFEILLFILFLISIGSFLIGYYFSKWRKFGAMK